MLALLFPKVIVNISIPVLMAASTLAQRLGLLNTFFRHIAQLALVIATVTNWLAQPTELLHGMVKRPLGCDTNTIVKVIDIVVSVNGKSIKYKPYPEPALFIVEEAVRVYSCELMVLLPGKNVGVPVRHNVVTGNEVYFVKYKEDLNVEGEILKLASDDGQIHHCELIGKGKADRVIQKGQCLGSIYPLLDARNSFTNKNNFILIL